MEDLTKITRQNHTMISKLQEESKCIIIRHRILHWFPEVADLKNQLFTQVQLEKQDQFKTPSGELPNKGSDQAPSALLSVFNLYEDLTSFLVTKAVCKPGAHTAFPGLQERVFDCTFIHEPIIPRSGQQLRALIHDTGVKRAYCNLKIRKSEFDAKLFTQSARTHAKSWAARCAPTPFGQRPPWHFKLASLISFKLRTGGSFGGIQARYNVLSRISRTYIHALICLIEGSTEANDYQCASMSTTAR